MKTYRLNNEKKAMKELGADQLDNVAGGYVYYNEETGKYEVIKDSTWETVASVKDYDTAWRYCIARGYNPSKVSKSVVDYCRGLLNKASEEDNA
jgi:hypothetical protein